MAITASTFNNFIHDGYNPYWIKTGCDNSTKLNFSMVHYVRVGRWNPTEDVGYFRAKPNPQGEIFFNPQKVISAYLSGTCIPTVTGWTQTQEAAATIQVYWGEEFDNTAPGFTPTGVTLYDFSSATGIHYVLNSYENPEDGYQLSGISDTTSTVTYHKLCTDWDSTYYYPIRRSEWMSLSYYQRPQTLDNQWNILTYDISGTPIGHFVFNPREKSSDWLGSYQLPAGTNNFVSGYNHLSGLTQAILPASVHYYNLYAGLSGASLSAFTRQTEIYKFRITDDCSPYENIRIAWLNHWGGYDYWTFPQKNRVTIDRKNNEWERFRGYYFQSGDNTRTNLNVELNKKIFLTTDFLSQTESNYVSNLFKSTEIYIITSTGGKIPVQMVETSSEVKTKVNDRIINYSFTLEYCYGILPQTT